MLKNAPKISRTLEIKNLIMMDNVYAYMFLQKKKGFSITGNYWKIYQISVKYIK